MTLTPADEPMDGSSLLNPTLRRERMLTEFFADSTHEPQWGSIRTFSYHYIETYRNLLPNGEPFREFYNLTNDAFELTNLRHRRGSEQRRPTNPPVSVLSALLTHYRACKGVTCPPQGDTIKPKGVDIQTQNGTAHPVRCPGTPTQPDPLPGKVDDCDKVIYSFDKPINPSSLADGWDGTGSQQVTLTINGDAGDPPAKNDVIKVQWQGVPKMGKVDLGRKDYVGLIPRPFPSPMTMSPDLKTVTIELDGGTVAASQQGAGTMTWKGYDAIQDAVGNTADPAPNVPEGGASDREF